MRGGGSKAFWNFSENSSILEGKGVPNSIFALLSFYFQFAMSHCPCVYVTALLSQVPQPACFWQLAVGHLAVGEPD